MTWRVYYNARAYYPNVWSVDNGDPACEVECAGVVLCGCFWRTEQLTPDERLTTDVEAAPVAWIAVEASAAERVGDKIVFVP